LWGLRTYLVAGIANPMAFEAIVARLGARVVGKCYIRDHHVLTPSHLKLAAKSGADLVLCTEKDLFRMKDKPYASELVALTCTVAVAQGENSLIHQLKRVLSCSSS
jgi:tetraacyldisaccharide-1-P 4'-kinase